MTETTPVGGSAAESDETALVATGRRSCWQVDGATRSVYLDLAGHPVAPVGGPEPWSCTAPCTTVEGGTPTSVQILRRKIADPDNPDRADDPKVETRQGTGRPRPDPRHLLKHAKVFAPAVEELPTAVVRAATIDLVERAMAVVRVLVADPGKTRRGVWHVVDIGGFRDFFHNGPEGALIATRSCRSKKDRKSRCSPTCPAGTQDRPAELTIESMYPLDDPGKFEAAARSWPAPLIGGDAMTNEGTVDAAAALAHLRRLAGSAPSASSSPGSGPAQVGWTPRNKRRSRNRRRTGENREGVLLLIDQIRGVEVSRHVRVDGGRWMKVDLPEAAIADLESFRKAHPFLVVERGLAVGFAAGPAGA